MFLLTCSWPGRDRRNWSRNAAEGRCWTSVCAFSSEDSDAECRVTITIPFFARRKQVLQSAWSKEKKDWRAKLKKSQKIKSPRKSNPPQYLWGCFEGVFVPDLTRLGMREGVFVPDLTRSGVRVRALGLVWTSGPTRSDRDQHQTRSRTRHRNLTRLVSYDLLTSLLANIDLTNLEKTAAALKKKERERHAVWLFDFTKKFSVGTWYKRKKYETVFFLLIYWILCTSLK